MSKYYVDERFWSGETGRELKQLGKDAQLLALFLITNPMANPLGLYNFTIEHVARYLPMTIDEAKLAMDALIGVDFVSYNDDTGMVFVHNMVSYQNGFNLKVTDTRLVSIHNKLRELPANEPLVQKFKSMYNDYLHLPKDNQPVLKLKPLQEYTAELGAGFRASGVVDMSKFSGSVPVIQALSEMGVSIEEIMACTKSLAEQQGVTTLVPNYIYSAVRNQRMRAAGFANSVPDAAKGQITLPVKGRQVIEPVKYTEESRAENIKHIETFTAKHGGNVEVL